MKSLSFWLASVFAATGFVMTVGHTSAVSALDSGIERIFDDQGRELIPKSHVVLAGIHHTPQDDERMIRLGSSFQVVRVPIGWGGAWSGQKVDVKALSDFDELVLTGEAPVLFSCPSAPIFPRLTKQDNP